MNRDRAGHHSQSPVEAEEVNIAQSQKFDIVVNSYPQAERLRV
jgi:hypothetical protein